MVRCGVAWRGVAWRGVVWCGVVRWSENQMRTQETEAKIVRRVELERKKDASN